MAGFGKHPGWDDHIDDIGLVTESLRLAKTKLYVEGIGGQIDAGAWDKLTEEQRVAEFQHVFLWQRGGQALIGRAWSSVDGKGRARFPMVACAHCFGLPLPWVVEKLLPEFDELHRRCAATKSAADVQAIFRRVSESIRVFVEELPATLPPSSVAAESRVRLLTNPRMGTQREGLLRILYQMSTQMTAYLAETAKAAGTVPEGPMPRHIRLPSVGTSPAEELLLWSWFFNTELAPRTPVLLLQPLEQNWVDAIVGEPGSAEFFCLKAGPKAVLPASDVPYSFGDDVRRKSEKLIAALQASDGVLPQETVERASEKTALKPLLRFAESMRNLTRPSGGKVLVWGGIVVVVSIVLFGLARFRSGAKKSEQEEFRQRPSLLEESHRQEAASPVAGVAASQFGVCVLTSDPAGAEFFVDEKSLGATGEVVANLDVGPHTLVARYSLLGEQSHEVNVMRNHTNKFVFTFPHATLTVSSDPAGATVFVGTNQLAGNTPLTVLVPPGRVAIVVSKGNQSAALETNLSTGTLWTPAVTLTSGEGWLDVDSDPTGADVYWGEKPLGKTPLKAAPVAQGLQELVLKYPELEDARQAVQVWADRTNQAPVVRFAYGSLTVTSDPSNATVWVDGKLVGTNPVKPGRMQLEIGAADYQSEFVDVDIVSGQTTKTNVVLRRGTGKLVIDSEPPGAQVFQVFVDGQPRGLSPLTIESLAGVAHEVRAAYGEQEKMRTVTVKKSGEKTVSFRFVVGPREMTNSLGMVLVWVPGVPETGSGCWVGKYEVTQEEYERAMGNNPSKYRGPRRPVEEIDYQEAEDFCKKLTERSGDKYFLPTKDQWTFIRGDAELNDQYAWMGKDYQVGTSPVGENRKPNKFGLYDVLGNVWVWCRDGKIRGHAFDSMGGGLQGRIIKDDESSLGHRAPDVGFRCLLQTSGNSISKAVVN
jgi:hypothetical protein